MPTLRWSFGIVVALLGAGVVLYFRGEGNGTAHAELKRELVGHIDVPGLDPRRVWVRCLPLRYEDEPEERTSEVGADGVFRIGDLADTDYRLELVSRADPSFVLARADHVRPGGEPFVFAPDPGVLWGEPPPNVTPNTD
jgi:hypothetical protein